MALTLEQHLAHVEPPEGLAELILAVGEGCAAISAAVGKGGLGDIIGALETTNVQGEEQKKLDVLANEILLSRCAGASRLLAMASEEMDTIHAVRRLGTAGGFLLLFDPLDGSSNIDVNVSIGTIFSVLPAPHSPVEREPSEGDFLQAGRNQAAAGYVVYGPQTTMVLTIGRGVSAFTLDPESGEWRQTAEAISIPASTKEFAINASNQRHWAAPVSRYVQECLAGETGPRGKNFNMRWVGSMVADVHRIVMRGGVFLYPWDAREPTRAGKLRLMYEANPMAFVVEQAGGASFDGRGATMELTPSALHQRVAVLLGSRDEVERLAAYHAHAVAPA
ncbi:class 1 fructose-bisphosphatase [Phenylobacterium sp.]|jgi:fructose-1,6-bisphosphatase I|uniref:class 1 fructose-bisphosphatase n=1 Tax=Phenylobacterium sp. TaxID=1871053 RepID=UPI002E3585CB|nr:class 1 fructose-bisphosphatase [Phenylobacterium sp.]HEX2559668.1 class 1 fructose-bisphosphatase [Phenylobacterium sp.]